MSIKREILLKRNLSYIFIAFFFIQNNLYGASQGSLGTSSSGDISIELALSDATKISDIDDASFGSWSGSGNLTDNDDACVYATNAGGSYNITATGDGPSSSFQLSDGSGNYLNYAFRWNDVAGTNSGGTNLTSGIIATGQTGASTTSADCLSGSALNARIRIRITANNLSLATAGSYSGSVTISVAPE